MLTSIIVLILAIVLRGLVAMGDFKTVNNVPFTISGYFDARHTIRWLVHLCASVIGFIAMPEIMHFLTQYVSWIDKLTIILTTLIGYSGYDLIKWAEKIVKKKAKKIEENIDEEDIDVKIN
jgi:hypothetical protein